MEWYSGSTEETIQIAKDLATTITTPKTIALKGDLGVGKTQFAKGIALGLGIENALETLISPTFNLMQTYKGGRFPFYHWDWYRLKTEEDVYELGFFEYKPGAVYLVEWAEKFSKFFDEQTLWIQLNYEEQMNERKIVVL